MDETSRRRGHQDRSLFVDLERAKVLYATERKDASTVEAFTTELVAHGGQPTQVREVCNEWTRSDARNSRAALS